MSARRDGWRAARAVSQKLAAPGMDSLESGLEKNSAAMLPTMAPALALHTRTSRVYISAPGRFGESYKQSEVPFGMLPSRHTPEGHPSSAEK